MSSNSRWNLFGRAKQYFGATVAAVAGLGVIIGGIASVYAHRDWFGFATSYVTVRPMASTREYMLFLVENEGNRPASIGRVTGEFHFYGSKSTALSGNLRLDVLEYAEGKSLVPAQGSQQMRVNFADHARLDTLESYLSGVGEIKATECTFGFEVVNYDGSRELLRAVFDCRRFLGQYLGFGSPLPLKYPVGSPPP